MNKRSNTRLDKRQALEDQRISEKDLVRMTIEVMSRLEMIDLQELIMQAEMELDYRQENTDDTDE